MHRYIATFILIASWSVPSHARLCDWVLTKLRVNRAPEVANAIDVGELARARWRRLTDGHGTEFKSKWGHSLVFMGGHYLIVSIRPETGSFDFDDDLLVRVRAVAPPIEKRVDVAIDYLPLGAVGTKPGWYTLYLGREQVGDAAFVPMAARVLKTFFQDLPFEVARAKKNPRPSKALLPESVSHLDWKVAGRSWDLEEKNKWGRTRIHVSETYVHVTVQPEPGDYVFTPRERDKLIARAPEASYRLGRDYNFAMEMFTTTDRGHYELYLSRGDLSVEAYAGTVRELLTTFLRDLPAAVPGDILTGKRPAEMFDPGNSWTLDPMSRAARR